MDIKLYKSPWRAIKIILLCSLFVFAGIFLLAKTDSPGWVGWLSIVFFGLCFPVGLFHLFDRRPQIIINEIGIFDRMAYSDFINWEVIRGAYPIDIHGRTLICLVVDETFEPKIKKKNSVKKFNRELGAQELNLDLGQIRVDELKLTEFIVAMASIAPSQRKEQINAGRLTF